MALTKYAEQTNNCEPKTKYNAKRMSKGENNRNWTYASALQCPYL
jgi:hypothetical protein